VINKILFIKNVGRFVDYSCHGDVEFQKLTLIFGENGRGKTMLSAILRSLGIGDAQSVLERKSIKSPKEPEVCIRVNSASHTFKNGSRNTLVPELDVFDTTFINENVYSGDLWHVVRCVRPLLEGNLRLRFPKHFKRTEWLGDFIGKIHGAQANDPLHLLQPKVSDFEAINDYSKKYHHDQNPGESDSVKVDDTQLQSYARKALRFVSGA
jgi:wobble nucleotide-excising tRNase